MSRTEEERLWSWLTKRLYSNYQARVVFDYVTRRWSTQGGEVSRELIEAIIGIEGVAGVFPYENTTTVEYEDGSMVVIQWEEEAEVFQPLVREEDNG